MSVQIALAAEVDRLRHDIERHVEIACELATECESLRAELEECKQDAEHFIWLANELGLCIMTMNADPSYFAEDDGDAVTAWRKAIDAARKGEEE